MTLTFDLHMHTPAHIHVYIHEYAHTYMCHFFFYVGSFLVVVMLLSNPV